MNIEFEWKDLVDLVDNASSDDINRIAHAISDIINVLNSDNGNNVDLSNYYTKTEVDDKDNELQRGVDFVLGQIANFQFDLNLKENLSNKTDTISDQPSMDKYPSEVAVFEAILRVDNSLKGYVSGYSYSKDETNTQISDAIGDVETALENIIEKYGLGGDAS